MADDRPDTVRINKRTGRPYVIGLDVDGVIRDFLGRALNVAERILGRVIDKSEITGYDIETSLGMSPIQRAEFRVACSGPGFCSLLPWYVGAIVFVRQLREFGSVYAITAPFGSPTWARESELWLQEHFDFSTRDVVHAKRKHLVAVDVLIEDSTENLAEWAVWNPDGLPILLSRPYNASAIGPRLRRANSYHDVLELVRNDVMD